MPPRIRSSSCQAQLLLTCIEPTPSSSLSFPTAALAPLHRPTASSSSSSPSPTCHRAFSTTPAPQDTRLRRQFKDWAESNKTVFRRPLAQPGTNYLGRVIPTSDGQKPTPVMPFPTNPHFQSQRVLSEKARELIWREVMVLGTPIKAVSAKYFVDMRRVAAVVRMKEIEKKWVQEDKPLARRYARAVMRMLPGADLGEGEVMFESINDVHVHSHTTQQLFVPTSESREFTRADAAKAFGERVLPPDDKLRIPELVDMERNIDAGMTKAEAHAEFVRAAAESERAFAEKHRAQLQAAEDRKLRVDTGRFEFRFEKINSEDVGPAGRSRRGVGWRYGVPFSDRKRGQIKIPTSVE